MPTSRCFLGIVSCRVLSFSLPALPCQLQVAHVPFADSFVIRSSNPRLSFLFCSSSCERVFCDSCPRLQVNKAYMTRTRKELSAGHGLPARRRRCDPPPASIARFGTRLLSAGTPALRLCHFQCKINVPPLRLRLSFANYILLGATTNIKIRRRNEQKDIEVLYQTN